MFSLKSGRAMGHAERPTPSLVFLLVLILAALSCAACGEAEAPGLLPSSAEAKIPLPDMDPERPYPVVRELGVPIVTEGDEPVRLYAEVFRPQAEGRFPALLQAVAYRREIFALGIPADPEALAAKGYAVILTDVRGTGSSEGTWGIFSAEEIDDLAWIIDEWIPRQPWSNGKVGMFGPSYMGINQYLTAARKPEHLKALFPGVSMADAYRDIFYQGGIFNQEFILFWAVATVGLSVLPGTQLLEDPVSAIRALWEHVTNIPELLTWLETTTDEAFFHERSPMYTWEDLEGMPVFATGGWFCIFTRGSLLNHTYLSRQATGHGPQSRNPAARKLIMGPWYHGDGAILAGLPRQTLHQRWFDWHLKADEDPLHDRYDILDPTAPVHLYVMGAERWRKERSWPLERARREVLYLSGERQEQDRNPSLNNGTLLWAADAGRVEAGAPGTEPTTITHRPPAFAGERSRSAARWLVGLPGLLFDAEDERENELRTLTFSTAPLTRDVEVTGPAVLRLWARTRFDPVPPEGRAAWAEGGAALGLDRSPLLPKALETDVHWVVNLNDVFPDGRVRNLTSGWLAASHRRDPARPDWTQPGYDPFDYPEDHAPSPIEEGKAYEYVIEIWPTSNVFRAGHQIRIDIANSDVPHLLPTLVPSASEVLHDPQHPSRLVLSVVPLESTNPDQWIDDPEAYFSGREPW